MNDFFILQSSLGELTWVQQHINKLTGRSLLLTHFTRASSPLLSSPRTHQHWNPSTLYSLNVFTYYRPMVAGNTVYTETAHTSSHSTMQPCIALNECTLLRKILNHPATTEKNTLKTLKATRYFFTGIWLFRESHYQPIKQRAPLSSELVPFIQINELMWF